MAMATPVAADNALPRKPGGDGVHLGVGSIHRSAARPDRSRYSRSAKAAVEQPQGADAGRGVPVEDGSARPAPERVLGLEQGAQER